MSFGFIFFSLIMFLFGYFLFVLVLFLGELLGSVFEVEVLGLYGRGIVRFRLSFWGFGVVLLGKG